MCPCSDINIVKIVRIECSVDYSNRYIVTQLSGFLDIKASKVWFTYLVMLWLLGTQYPDKKCLDFEAYSINNLITGHLVTVDSKSGLMLWYPDTRYLDFGYPDLEFDSISGLRSETGVLLYMHSSGGHIGRTFHIRPFNFTEWTSKKTKKTLLFFTVWTSVFAVHLSSDVSYFAPNYNAQLVNSYGIRTRQLSIASLLLSQLDRGFLRYCNIPYYFNEPQLKKKLFKTFRRFAKNSL